MSNLEVLGLEQFDTNKDQVLSLQEVENIFASGQGETFKKMLNRTPDNPKDKEILDKAFFAIADGFKEGLLEDGVIDKTDIGITYVIQMIGVVRGTYSKDNFDGVWGPETERVFQTSFSPEEKSKLKIVGEVKAGPHTNETKKGLTASNDNQEQIKPSNDNQTEPITFTQERQDKLVKSGEVELNGREKEIKEAMQKLVQINLISQVASMYKEYLQSIKEAIRFKSIPDIFSKSPNMFKDERYGDQINIIGEKVRYLDNLISFLSNLGNYDEVINLDLEQIVNKLFISEKELSENGFMSQPLINGVLYDEATTGGAIRGYEEIRRMLLTPNLTPEQAEQIKIGVFEKIRQFDKLGNDDNGLVLDSGEAISSRITTNVLQNQELRKKPDINDIFTSLETFSSEEKEKLLTSLKGGKERLRTFVNGTGLLEKLGFQNDEQINDFIDSIYESGKENLGKINDKDVKEQLKSKIQEQIKFQRDRLPEEKRAEFDKKSEVLLTDTSISNALDEFKKELIFMTFGKAFMNQVLENNSNFVYEVSKKDGAVNLYRDVEGIGEKMSDKTFNRISIGTQFLTEQIAIMLVSGIIGGALVKGVSYPEILAGITSTGMTAETTRLLLASLSVEGTGFYLSYTAINGTVHEKEIGEIMKNYNNYDLLRTIIFLGVLRNFPVDKFKESPNIQNSFLREMKNISLDTTAILGTDILIRTGGMLAFGKEGLKTDVDGNITLESTGEFLVEELSFIIPLVIGIRQSDKAVAKLFENGNKPKIEATITENEVIIQIEGLKREIRALRQKRNSLRNDGKSHKEVSRDLAEKKREYKQTRDENSDILAKSGTGNTEIPTAVLPNQNKPQNTNDNGKNQKDSNFSKENTSTSTGKPKLSGNIEDVMTGYGTTKGINTRFQELLAKGGDKKEAERIIEEEINAEVKRQEDKGNTLDVSELLEYKNQRIAEFNKLVEIKEKGLRIPNEIDMKIDGKPWKLSLRNVDLINEYFGKYVENMGINNGDRKNEFK